MRRIAGTLVLLFIAGCAPKTSGSTSSAAAPPLETLLHGLWSGEASESPLGKQPYAIVFRKEGSRVVAETPPMLGEEELPPGAFQRFEFPEGMSGKAATFKTSMGSQGFLEGDLQLDETRSSKTKAIFCEAGNCDSMELTWESLASDRMNFQVRIDGKPHVKIGLTFDGEMP